MKRMKIMAGHQQVMPYLTATNADELIDFIRKIFNGQEMMRLLNRQRKIQHSELKIGDCTLLIAESQDSGNPGTACLYIYVQDTDKTYYEALDAGAESLMLPIDEDDHIRSAGFKDPFGNTWWISTIS
ncbi:VOC family protein [Sinomicrobium sp.]